MDISQGFGEVLVEFRKRAGTNQEALAHECGLDRTYISLLERGRRQPSLKTLFAIAKALGVCPSELVACLEKKLVSG